MPEDTENESCPACDTEMFDDGLAENWRVYVCPSCGVEVLRPVTDDHGGVSHEDLNGISSFTADQN